MVLAQAYGQAAVTVFAQRYDALQTSEAAATAAAIGSAVQMVPTTGFADQNGQQRSSSSSGVKPSTSQTASEPGDARGYEDRSRLLKDKRISDGGLALGRGD